MKRSLIFILTLAFLASCGKDNKSGKKPLDYSYAGLSPYTAGMATPAFGQYSVSQVINENPCYGAGGYQMQRSQVQVPLTNFPTVIPVNDVYVGVTSYGDVATIVGTGGVPTFIAYVCPRSYSSGQGYLRGISLGSYSNCAFKPLTAATMQFADGTSANFRMMDYGSSANQKFSMCR